jgi:SAM-dependent methyltransferase
MKLNYPAPVKLTKIRQTGEPCVICGNTNYYEFKEYSMYVDPQGRPNIFCRGCKSVLRQRQFYQFIQTLDLSDKRVLYFAPHISLSKKIKPICGNCITIDLQREWCGIKLGKVDVLCDIQDLIFKENVFDIVICKHVLEHVDDDMLAVSEIRRVIKPGGMALVMIPFFDKLAETENFPPVEHYERYFPNEIEHVRRFGRDIVTRYPGWDVKMDEICGEIFIFRKT